MGGILSTSAMERGEITFSPENPRVGDYVDVTVTADREGAQGVRYTLATPEGRWIGKSSGSMRDLHVPLNENLRFPLTGTYHFEIEQAMREPVLKGISDIGLFIEKQ